MQTSFASDDNDRYPGALALRGISLFAASTLDPVKLSEFWTAMTTEFGGAYGRVLASDLVLRELGSRTAREALAAGESPRTVWLALCRETDVPVERRHGAGVPPPRD